MLLADIPGCSGQVRWIFLGYEGDAEPAHYVAALAGQYMPVDIIADARVRVADLRADVFDVGAEVTDQAHVPVP